ncbi:MAG: phosphotransferase [Caulobacteraceae bacterium]|nr:phosphotransferase [Caulobacteraceae bacterium]
MLKLPRTSEEISAAWLSEALSVRYPGLVVEDVRVLEQIHGACTKVRLGLACNRPFASRVMMKAGFEPHSAAMMQMHVNEMHAYRDLTPTLSVNTCEAHYAGEDGTGRALVILEDLTLREARFLSLQAPIGYDLAARFLEGLAAIHARWWASPELKDRFAWAPDTSEAQFAHYFELLLDPQAFGRFAASPRCAAMPRSLLDPPRIRAAHAAMRAAHEAMPKTINHGDMHLGNLFVDAEGRPGFLDWQPRLAPWSIDVSYFMTAGLDLVDRRRWEGALLQHYLAALRAHGIEPPGFDEAWAAYRRDLVWGLLIWMLNGSEFQTESNNTAAATRFAMAVVDHDTFKELGV